MTDPTAHSNHSLKNMTELTQWIDQEWQALMDVVHALHPDQMQIADAEGWSVRDHLAHLAAWERLLLRHYLEGAPMHIAMGFEEDMVKNWGDEDEVNEVIFQRNRRRAPEEVLAWSLGVHERLMAKLGALSLQNLSAPSDPDDPAAEPVLNHVIYNTCEHYMEHRNTIERMLDTWQK